MWRKVKKEDLYATLSEKEVRVFGQNEAADESVIEQQLENTVSENKHITHSSGYKLIKLVFGNNTFDFSHICFGYLVLWVC